MTYLPAIYEKQNINYKFNDLDWNNPTKSW